MAVIGVLTCEILELEFAHLLAGDPDVAHITVLDDTFSARFLEALKSTGHPGQRRIPLLRVFSLDRADRLEVLVRVLKIGLHSRKRLLQEALLNAAKEMSRYVDGILLGYGLCGNALERPEELLREAGVPIFIPMDEDHPVDDCVGLIIGGRECYYSEQCRVAGTFFMIPGWTHHWRMIFEAEHGAVDFKMAKRLFAHYERSLLVTNVVLSEESMRQNIEEFNRLFGFRTEVREGTLNILQSAWEAAKASIMGRRTSINL
jgi:hypothetical protein